MKKEDLIHKWLSGEISEEEYKLFQQLEDYEQLIQIDNTAKNFKQDFKYSKQQLLDEIGSKEQSGQKVRTLKFNKNWIKVAAIFLLAITTMFFLLERSEKTIKTGKGETLAFELPDASEVQLNVASEINYNLKDWDKNRSLDLNGEAFFSVTKGKTFSVNTAIGTVKVLGTKFNVFNRDEYLEVVCYEGAVMVSINNKVSDTLRKGEAFKFHNSKQASKYTIQEKTANWLNGFSKYEDRPVRLVANEMERQFDLEITFNATTIENKRFTGVIFHNDKMLAIKTLTKSLNLSYKLEGNQVIISSSLE